MSKDEALKWLERRGSRRNVERLARYGVRATRASGVPMGTMQALAKRLGMDHALAAFLWESGMKPAADGSSMTRCPS